MNVGQQLTVCECEPPSSGWQILELKEGEGEPLILDIQALDLGG